MQRAAALFFAIFAIPALAGVQAQAQSSVQPGEAPASLQVIIPDEEFMPAAVRAKQSDDFDNPAFPFVQAGEAAWGKTEGAAGKACKDCHGAAPEQRVTAARGELPQILARRRQRDRAAGEDKHLPRERTARAGIGRWTRTR